MIVIVPGGKQSQILLRRLRTKSYFVSFAQNPTVFPLSDEVSKLYTEGIARNLMVTLKPITISFSFGAA